MNKQEAKERLKNIQQEAKELEKYLEAGEIEFKRGHFYKSDKGVIILCTNPVGKTSRNFTGINIINGLGLFCLEEDYDWIKSYFQTEVTPTWEEVK